MADPLNVIDTQRPTTVQVDLTEEMAMESQGVCAASSMFCPTLALPGPLRVNHLCKISPMLSVARWRANSHRACYRHRRQGYVLS